jgi:4-amino-4-deoxy-L-arabinose transferase-like glycosyltransferase
MASFCLTALPWYVLCARRNPDFFRIFIIEHNFKRYLTPEFQHLQPFWYYLPVLLVAFLPWTAAMFWTAFAGMARIRQSRKAGHHTLFLLTWSLFVVLFFTLSQSKLPGYILPAVPALSLLLAHGCGNLPTLKESHSL